MVIVGRALLSDGGDEGGEVKFMTKEERLPQKRPESVMADSICDIEVGKGRSLQGLERRYGSEIGTPLLPDLVDVLHL